MPAERLLEVAEAARAVEQRLDEQQRPAVADAVERAPRSGRSGRDRLGHGRTALLRMPGTVVTCNLQVTRRAAHGSAVVQLQEAIAAAAERVGPSVVGLGRGWGLGSGVVIGEGRVLTNAHNLRATQVTVAFADGRAGPARWPRADPDLDLAVARGRHRRARPRSPGSPATRPASARPVLALANPGGRGLRVTLGLRLRRRAAASAVRAAGASRGAIEHTAPLPRGSSGGPLVDPEGRLLGLNALRLDGGLILAVPATRGGQGARAAAGPRARRRRSPRLGVAVAPPRVARRMRRAVGLPERDGPAGARRRGRQPGRARRHRARRPARGRRRPRARRASTPSTRRSTRSPAPAATLELTVVRGTEERAVTVAFDTREEAAA